MISRKIVMRVKFLKWLFKVLSGILFTFLMLFCAMWIASYLDTLGYRYNGKMLKFLAILAVLPLIAVWELLRSVFRKSFNKDSPGLHVTHGQQKGRRFYKSYRRSYYRDRNKV